MVGNKNNLNLSLPEQKLASLSFCETTPKSAKDWVSSLPMANVGETSRRLYHAVIELNQLIIAPQQRLQLLEAIRGPVHFVCGELGRHFLGHSISLPEKQRKIANLAQALQLHLAGGYKTVLSELAEQGSIDKNRRLLAQAGHRVVTDLSHTILRAAQLYCPSPAGSWLESHQIYQFACDHNLADVPVADETARHRPESTLSDSYKRLLLLGCSRPNQLRQHELGQSFELFELWTHLVSCGPESLGGALFVINVDRDAPPFYRTLMQDNNQGFSYGFDTTDLSHHLTEYLSLRRTRKKEAESLLDVPIAVSDALLAHLGQALGILTKRNFKRMASSGTLEICVGLSGAHYFIANETEFNRFLVAVRPPEDDENVFMSRARRKEDAWSGAFDAAPSDEGLSHPDTPINFRGADGRLRTGDGKAPAHRSYRVSLINTSPGGYCVGWEAEVPSALQAGEVVAVREQASHPWSVAVIRWIRQVRQKGTQIGIELLAPNASPCGVRLLQKVGNHSEFLRGLLLPELSTIGQPATLIAPRLPFQTGNRIVLFNDGVEDQCQLSRRISATGSVSQFELKFLNPGGGHGRHREHRQGPLSDPGGESGGEDDFDSLWPSL